MQRRIILSSPKLYQIVLLVQKLQVYISKSCYKFYILQLIHLSGKGIADYNSPYNQNLTEDILSLKFSDEVKQTLTDHFDEIDFKRDDNDNNYVHR